MSVVMVRRPNCTHFKICWRSGKRRRIHGKNGVVNRVDKRRSKGKGRLTMTSQTPKDSPSLPDTPFKAFLDSPVSKQVSKFQEIAKEYSRKTLGKWWDHG